MTFPAARAPFRTAAAIAVIVVCFAVLTWYFWRIRGVLFQCYALAALFVVFQSVPAIARWRAGIPLAHRIVLYVLLGCMVAGHFTLSTRRYYPFVAWDIFSSVSNQETVFCRELIGTTAAQKKIRLLAEQIYPSITQFDLPTDKQPEKLNLLVSALARTYNARHAADPLTQIDLVLMAVKLHPPPGQTRSQPSCELLQRFDLSSGPSS